MIPESRLPARGVDMATVRQVEQPTNAGIGNLNFLSDINTPCHLLGMLKINVLRVDGPKLTRQMDTKGRVGNSACCTSDLKPPVAETGEAAGVARLLAQKNRKHSEPVMAMIIGILALAVLNIAIYGIDNLNFFIYGTIGIGLTFEYGWISVILRAAVAGDHDYDEDAHE